MDSPTDIPWIKRTTSLNAHAFDGDDVAGRGRVDAGELTEIIRLHTLHHDQFVYVVLC